MKTTILKAVEIEITTVRLELPVRYGEEDIPNDFPRRVGDTWTADVNIDTGQIADWPQGKSGHLEMKVCDEGIYSLFGPAGNKIAEIHQDYVPNKLVPGQYGDYVDLEIDANGVITNWPKKPDVRQFFKRDEDED